MIHRFPPMIHAQFLERENRFVSRFQLGSGEVVRAHSPNTGSMKGLLTPGAASLLWDSCSETRKYRLSWKAVKADGVWVGIDTGLPNLLAAKLLAQHALPSFPAFQAVEREKKMGDHSRIDILARDQNTKWFIEVKNVTLMEGGVARFPDAVTARGLKHLHELRREREAGNRAAMIYVIQREDCVRFSPAYEIDAEYAKVLQEVEAAGVLVVPVLMRVSEEGVSLAGEIPYSFEVLC